MQHGGNEARDAEQDDVELGGRVHGVGRDGGGLGGRAHDGGQGGGELGDKVRGMVRDDMVHDGHGIDEWENVLLDEPRGHMAKA